MQSSRPVSSSVPLRIRAERFGAFVQIAEPPAVVAIDRAFARELGVDGGPLWEGDAPSVLDSTLVAPTEMHVAVTERCTAGCAHCYVDAKPDGHEPAFETIASRLDEIAAMGVFRVAFGGGEATTHPELARIVDHARSRGLEPTLTTSGLGLSRERAKALRGLAQVNVSLDGLGEVYRDVRGYDGTKGAVRAIEWLVEAGIPVGINVVLTRTSLSGLEATAKAAEAIGAREMQLLRLKPEGRARLGHLALRPRIEDWDGFTTRLETLSKATAMLIRVDCSLVPFLADGRVDPSRLELFAVTGCEGGRSLATLDVRGGVHPCSFERDSLESHPTVAEGFESAPSIDAFRRHHAALPEPCSTCAYRAICRGGCRIAARVLASDPFAPDPECPRVIRYRAARANERPND